MQRWIYNEMGSHWGINDSKLERRNLKKEPNTLKSNQRKSTLLNGSKQAKGWNLAFEIFFSKPWLLHVCWDYK